MDGGNRGRHRQARRHHALQEQPGHVSARARDLLTDDDLAIGSEGRRRGQHSTVDPIVVGDRDHTQTNFNGLAEHVDRCRPAVTVCGVEVEVGDAVARWQARNH